MSLAIIALSAQHVHPIKPTAYNLIHLFKYYASNPEVTIWYTASDMVLHIHSDVSYLTASLGCSRAGEHIFISAKLDIPTIHQQE
eukprot:2459521-Ditylum_brightwellii.AAC.1